MKPDLIVVTDLDATLLDHYSYSFAAAQPALNMLRDLHIPLILNSSKTAAEIFHIRQELQNKYPFVVENGAAIMFPDDKDVKTVSFGMNRAGILRAIHNLRDKYKMHFIGFADMSPKEVVEHTGLSLQAAELALKRDFTEPLLWQDSERQRQVFTEHLEKIGLSLIKGGRFWHVSSQVDKSKALDYLRDYYQQQAGTRPKVIALGDSENDLAMLAAADYPVLVKSPARAFPTFKHDNLLKTEEYGPAGWNQAIVQLLEEFH